MAGTIGIFFFLNGTESLRFQAECAWRRREGKFNSISICASARINYVGKSSESARVESVREKACLAVTPLWRVTKGKHSNARCDWIAL